jgi:hypothetical protein
MEIKILNIRKSQFSNSATEAFIDLQIGGLIIGGFKIVTARMASFYLIHAKRVKMTNGMILSGPQI